MNFEGFSFHWHDEQSICNLRILCNNNLHSMGTVQNKQRTGKTIDFRTWIFEYIYTVVMDCLQDLNKSIYGTSVLFNIIMFDIAIVSWTIFTGVFIPLQTGNVNYWRLFSNVLIVFLILFDLFSLYFLAHITEKEVKLVGTYT